MCGISKEKSTACISICNGMSIPEKADVLKLKTLEEILVAPINPFMQIENFQVAGK